MAIDLSFRDTGVCVLEKKDNIISCLYSDSCESYKMGDGFESLVNASLSAYHLTEYIKNATSIFNPNVIIIEVPCYTQSAKSALAIGICWGVVAQIRDAILIEPSALKVWSESKRGDGKSLVKEKVISRVYLSPEQKSNDNIVDAIGIALLFLDKIATIKYETDQRQSNFGAFILEH